MKKLLYFLFIVTFIFSVGSLRASAQDKGNVDSFTTEEIDSIHTLVVFRYSLTDRERTILEDKVHKLPILRSVMDAYDRGSSPNEYLRTKVNIALQHKMDSIGAIDKTLYRLLLLERAVSAMNYFQNEEIDNLCKEISRLTVKYENDTINRRAWLIINERIRQSLNINHQEGDEPHRNYTKQLLNYLNDNTLNDKTFEFEILEMALSDARQYNVCIRGFDKLYKRLYDDALFVSNNDKEILMECEMLYLVLRAAFGKEDTSGNFVEDLTALPNLETLGSIIRNPNLLLKYYELLAQLYLEHQQVDDVKNLIRKSIDIFTSEKGKAGNETYEYDMSTASAQALLAILDEDMPMAKRAIDKMIEILNQIDNSGRGILSLYSQVLFNFETTQLVDLLWPEYENYVMKCLPERETFYSLVNIGLRCLKQGKHKDFMDYVDMAQKMLPKISDNEALKADLDIIKGRYSLWGNKYEEALGYFKSAEKYLYQLNETEKLLELYSIIIDVLSSIPDTEKLIREYIDKYEAKVNESVWGKDHLWTTPKIKIYQIKFKYPANRQKKYIEEELKNSEKLLKPLDAMYYCNVLGDMALHNNDVEEALKYFELAFDYAICSNNIEDFKYLVSKLLFFYSITNKHLEKRQLLHGYISDVENGLMPADFFFLSSLSKQIAVEAGKKVNAEARFLFEKFSDAVKIIRQQSQGDVRTSFILHSIDIPTKVRYLIAADNRENESTGRMLKMMCEMISMLLPEFEREFGVNENYLQLIAARAQANTFLKEDYTLVHQDLNLIDSLITINPQLQYFRSNLPLLKINAAMAFQNLPMADQYIVEMSESLDDEAFQSANVAMFSDLMMTRTFTDILNERYDSAEDFATKRFRMVKKFVESNYGTLSEDERTAMGAIYFTPLDLNMTLSARYSTYIAKAAYDASLFYKNLQIESNNITQSLVLKSGSDVIKETYRKLQSSRSMLAGIVITDSLSRNEFLRVRMLCNELEDSLNLLLPDIAQMKIKRDATWNKVRDKLEKGEAAIEFIYDNVNYGALILRKGYKAPHYIQLISAEELDKYIGTGTVSREEVRQLYLPGSRVRPNFNGHNLYQKLWKPLEDELEGVNRIYYTPVGKLNSIQFAAIVDTTQTVLCQRYDLRLLSTTAQLLNSKKVRKDNTLSVDLIGGVKYDAHDTVSPNGGWPYLNNSTVEVAAVDSIIATTSKLTANNRRGGLNASEEWFGQQTGQYGDIVLLSTHGFFVTAKDAPRMPYFINKKYFKEDNQGENTYISPLLRSGIILADANPVWTNEEERPDDVDGVLTAAEIARLDFTNTDLVVLSACQTGMGEPTATEGVNGLQRGFKLAGADTVIMSLWLVDDRAGMMFMREFFALLANGQERHEAFKKARLALRDAFPSDPFFWAAFVMLD